MENHCESFVSTYHYLFCTSLNCFIVIFILYLNAVNCEEVVEYSTLVAKQESAWSQLDWVLSPVALSRLDLSRVE